MPDLQWAVFEASLDPVRGSEQGRSRPILVVSNEDFNQVTTNVTVLPLTSTNRHAYPAEVLLPQGEAGQPMDSIIMAHQVRTISKQRLGRLFGYLNNQPLRTAVRRAIIEHLDLDGTSLV